MAIPSEGLKCCKKCGIDKDISEFYVVTIESGRGRKAGSWLVGRCKQCTTAHQMRRYYSHAREERLVKVAAIKHAVIMAYGGYRCACCGETERLFLQLDHINNDGAEFRRKLRTKKQNTASGPMTYKWVFDHNFPPGFQILCANCNHGKRMNNGVCPHQTTCNDQRLSLVGSSEPKRNAPLAGEDMVCPESNDSAVVQ